jgi:ABC-type multidrug transport system fused ATPase/permease subunit
LVKWGQRQRLALARVFLRDSPILIFYEATSALDSESQQAIYRAIKNLGNDKTIIMISHRFSMMSIVDEVLVFSHGRIVESGSHENLLAGDTLYRKLYEKQQVVGA